MWERLRARAPTLAAFFSRQPSVLDHAVFTALVATSATALLVLDAAVRSVQSGGGLAWLLFALTAAQVGVFIGAVGAIVHVATFRRVGWGVAQAVGATVVLGVLSIERVHREFFGRFVDRAGVRLTWEAIRTGELHVGAWSVLAWVFVAMLACVSFSAVLHALAHVPRSRRVAAFASTAAPYALLAIATLAALRDVVFDPGAERWSAIREAVPWDRLANGAPAGETPISTAEDAWSAATDEHLFRLLRSRRSRLLDKPPAARVTPDILVVHVEGLRADMLRADVAPTLFAFARDCLAPERHYSTGNNTGGGMFGLLNGLSLTYYPLARKTGAQPIPLEVLRSLGYSESVYFVSDLFKYEAIFDLYFKGIVSETYRRTDTDASVDVADGHMVDAYLAARAARASNRPYFDYIVFDSTHYDYQYPPGFERFTPVDTLARGIGPIIIGPDLDARRPRGPAIRNRYKNSIYYVDSLLRRIFAAMRLSGALDRTVVVVTGDHGEEFWEQGRFGHGNAFNEAQLRVAFLMHLPGNPTTRYTYGSHADVMPTIFDYMGLDSSPFPFMTGKSLLRYDSALDAAVVGEALTGDQVGFWSVVMTEGQKFVFRNKVPFTIREARSAVDDHVLADYDRDLGAEAILRALGSKELR
jgi:hypothetical protein